MWFENPHRGLPIILFSFTAFYTIFLNYLSLLVTNNLQIIKPNNSSQTERLSALEDYQIMDSDAEVEFDELTMLASKICGTPIALITLLDEHRQWFKSNVGLKVSQTPIEHAFCAHTIQEEQGMMVIHDARTDERFSLNPLVTDDPNIVFYAGISLINPAGVALGSLCVIDRIPRKLTVDQLEALGIIARQVIAQMELKIKVTKLLNANTQLVESNKFMQRFATTAAHDLKNPLSSISISSELMLRELTVRNDEKLHRLASANLSSAKKLVQMVNDMLEYSLRPEALTSSKTNVDLLELVKRTIAMVVLSEDVKISLPGESITITASEIALQQIFINLLTNAIRYNDKTLCEIEISWATMQNSIIFNVVDNGPGIPQAQLQRIFEKDVTLSKKDRFQQQGTGIGLHTVRLLIEKLGGGIEVTSEMGRGSQFTFSIGV
ncbi:GAF domain-containing sensor histidine kinase [Pedobacter sp.]|uniref:GAF domain-containing sensor histidine kinase n=1 Tax=Pedobacter sp. TaxID=1411316 RepID=UPI003BAC551B